MKKGKIKSLICGALLATSTLGFAGCDAGSVTISDFSVDTSSKSFKVYDTFSTDGLKLNLEMSDGTTQEVDITNEMVTTSPDMTSSGEKKVTISYDGAEYTFTIFVGGYNKQEMLTKLQEFKETYDGIKDTSSVKVSASYDFFARYLNKSTTDSETSPSYSFTKEDLPVDDFLDFAYNTVLGQFTEDGLKATENSIIDSNNLKLKLNTLQTLQNVYTKAKTFNYADYIINNVIFPGSTAENVEHLTSVIMSSFAIDETSEDYVEDFVNKYYNKISNLQEFDPMTALEEFNTLLQNHCQEEVIKDIVNNEYTKLQNYVNEETSVDQHILSTYFQDLVDAFYSNNIALFETWYNAHFMIPDGDGEREVASSVDVDTAETRTQTKIMADNYINMFREVENMIYQVATAEENKFDFTASIETITESNDNIVAAMEEINAILEAATTNYESPYEITRFTYHCDLPSVSMVSYMLSLYDANALTMIDNLVSGIGLIDMALYSMPGFTEYDHAELVSSTLNGVLHDVLTLNVDYDYETYIENISALLNITDATAIAGFKTEFEQNKTLSIISYYLQQQYEISLEACEENQEDTDYLNFVPKVIDLVKHLEQLPVEITGDGVNWFNFEKEVYSLVNELTYFNQSLEILTSVLAPRELGTEDYYSHLIDNINTTIETYKIDLINATTQALNYILQYENPSEAYTALKSHIGLMFNDYIDGTYMPGNAVSGLVNVINNYSDENTKIIANAMMLCGIVTSGTPGETDYNELLQDIELPEILESVDFNKLINKLIDENTYLQSLVVKDVEVQYVTDENKNITKEIFTVSLVANSDIEIAQLLGEFKVSIEVTL